MKKKSLNYFILIITILIGFLLTTKFSNVFGSHTDWINQHTVIPEYFRMIFYKTGNILPNLALGYGGFQNIFNLSYYGLLSPIILLSYLFPFIEMPIYIIIINIILLIVSAILFYNFLEKKNFNNFINLISSLLFILSASFIFQMHRHIMFVNYMPFLIMALMGVDKLIKENKKSLLIISVFLMIMTSYYYSVGGILVVGIYYICTYLNYNKKWNFKIFSKNLGLFILTILTSVSMSAILLLPTFYTLLISRGGSESEFNLLSLMIPNLNFHDLFSGTYTIGLSVIAFISILHLFFTRKKNNVIIGTIISIVLFIPVFRFILNGGLYLREKCFIPFLPLCTYFIAYFLNDLFNKKINIKKFIIYLIIIFIPLYYFNQNTYSYLILIGFIITLLFFKKYQHKLIVGLYLIFIATFIFISENLNEDFVTLKEYNEIFNKDVSQTINEINEKDKSYYRTNNLTYPTKTVNKIYNEHYFTTNIYSSTYNKNYLNFLKNVFKISQLEYNYFLVPASYNWLFNSYMGVKYIYSEINPGLGYTKIDNNLYQNKMNYPLIYANSNILSNEEFSNYSYPYTNELLMTNVISSNHVNTNNPNIITKEVKLTYKLLSNEGVKITKNNNGYILEVENNGKLKIKLDNPLHNQILFLNLEGLKENSCRYDDITMTINNITNLLTCKTWIYANKNNTFRYVFAEETLEELEITLSKGIYNIDNIKTYVLDYNEALKWKNNIQNFNITSIENDTIKGNISLGENSYLVTSIPYDEGFTIKVNGSKVEKELINEGFLGIYLESGDYDIEITYESPWLKIGKIISCFGILIFVFIVINDYSKKNLKFKKKLSRENFLLK